MSDELELCGVELAGPILNGSGTFDAFVSKTITLTPRAGNPPRRLWEAAAGLINSIGLPNKGLAGFLAEDLPRLAQLPVPLIVSVMGFTRDELATLVAAVGERSEVSMIELNVSCPNVETGLVMGADPPETAAAVERVRTATDRPLIVKLTPSATEPAAVARAAEAAGADAIALVNTLRGMALDPRSGTPALGAGSGGLSGPAIRAVALEQVHRVAAAVSIPIVGMGGIASGRDAADFLQAGATCVAVGTESFRDPAAGRRIGAELDALSRKAPDSSAARLA